MTVLRTRRQRHSERQIILFAIIKKQIAYREPPLQQPIAFHNFFYLYSFYRYAKNGNSFSFNPPFFPLSDQADSIKKRFQGKKEME